MYSNLKIFYLFIYENCSSFNYSVEYWMLIIVLLFPGNMLSTLMGDCDHEGEPRPSSSHPMNVEPLD